MSNTNKYRFALALLQFSRAATELAEASKQLEDYDVSELYPFYLLNYEELAIPIKQWATVHANNLMSEVPERVINPACYDCPHIGTGISVEGACKGNNLCPLYPETIFTPEAAMLLLRRIGVETDGTYRGIQVAYAHVMQRRIYEKTVQ